MTERSHTIDWQAAYARLERVRQALDDGEALSMEAVERILQDRARALARPREAPATISETLELLVFALGEERYAVEAAQVIETIVIRELTPVPCTPAICLGVVNHRGRILPVLDLRRLFGLPAGTLPERCWIIVVEAHNVTVGIFTDGIVGTLQVGTDAIAPIPPALSGDRQNFLQGVTRDLVAVLDMDALARDSRIMVNE